MEVAIDSSSSPFQREVREWQQVDPNTGALLTGRVEADRWNNGSSKKYGVVVNSPNVSTANGTQLKQRKELEVIQARTVSGSLQVVRSSTVQSSSSRWPNLSTTNSSSTISSDNRINSNKYSSIDKNQKDNHMSESNFYKKNWNSSSESSSYSYERGRSASTEDITLQYNNANSSDDDAEPQEWRRVSKIRRSLQYPKTKLSTRSSRPTDLPENLVNISQLKKHLENGHTFNGNSYLKNIRQSDAVALDKILVDPIENENKLDAKNSIKKATFITVDSLRDIRGKLKRLSDESLYKDDILASPVDFNDVDDSFNDSSSNKALGNVKYRDMTPTDWHLRRKSYGFEEMPSNNSSMSRMETSTDSGIGRSGELWSSTEQKMRGTIITFGENADNTKGNLSSANGTNENQLTTSSTEVKRHSIAVDETKYVKDSKTLINLNGLNSKEWNSSAYNVLHDENVRRLKRVEFCKTEVHFAAESGRVNIVETDGKPPSTNNFRRRRRNSNTSNAYLEAINAAPSVMHFGDETRKDLEKSSMDSDIKRFSTENTKVDVTTTSSSTISTVNNDDGDEDLLDEISLRGILKNKPVKPRPYHLGENIENSQKLWGVRLKPTNNDNILWNYAEPETSVDDYDGNCITKTNGSPKPERPTSLFIDEHKMSENAKSFIGYSTKVKLNTSPSSASSSFYAWKNKENKNEHKCSLLGTTTLSSSSAAFDETSVSKTIIPMQPIDAGNNLKSTSLIMKTIKSANQFDEAMKNLTIFDRSSKSPDKIESDPDFGLGSSFKLISSINSSKSSSSSSILFEDFTTPNADLSKSKLTEQNVIKSTTPNIVINEISDDFQINRKPIAAPRMKKIGSATGLSLQLSQLRRIYEAADQSIYENEKVDKEVDLYFSNDETQQHQHHDDYTTELSGSWSRVKARRNILKQNKQNEAFSTITDIKKPETSLHESSRQKSQQINSNLLSIALHSPTEPIHKFEKTILKPKVNTYLPVTQTQLNESSTKNSTNFVDSRKTIMHNSNDMVDKNNVALKPVGGARKLKEHELFYFGLNVSPTGIKIDDTNNKKKFNDGKLNSDKPDLLINHSPNVERSSKIGASKLNYSPSMERSSKLISSLKSSTTEITTPSSTDSSPIYENLKPNVYNRKLDLERDEMILKELNEAADEAQKPTEKIKTPKKHRTTKPFETIVEEEKTIPKLMQSKAVQVSRGFNELLTRIKPINRISSASSSESISNNSTGRTKRLTITTNRTASDRATRQKTLSQSSEDSQNKSGRRRTQKETSVAVRAHGGSSSTSSSKRNVHSSHDTSLEDLNKAPPIRAPHRSRKSASSLIVKDPNLSESDVPRKAERHHRYRSSSGMRSSDDNKICSRKSRTSNGDSTTKEKIKPQVHQERNGMIKHSGGTASTTTTTTSSSKQRSSNGRHREKSSRHQHTVK